MSTKKLLYCVLAMCVYITSSGNINQDDDRSESNNEVKQMVLKQKQIAVLTWEKNWESIIYEFKENLSNDNMDYSKYRDNVNVNEETFKSEMKLSKDRSQMIVPLMDIVCYGQIDKSNELVDFFEYIFYNDPIMQNSKTALNGLVCFAISGNERARNFIRNNAFNDVLYLSEKIILNVGLLGFDNNRESLNYLRSMILKVQEKETFDLSYWSSEENALLSSIKFVNGNKHFLNQKENYYKPLIEQLLCSRDIRVQESASYMFHSFVGQEEISVLEENLWNAIDDKSVEKNQCLSAVYGLYSLNFISKLHGGQKLKINTSKIRHLFGNLKAKTLEKNKNGQWVMVDIEPEAIKDSRLSREFKFYFVERLFKFPGAPQEIPTCEPFYREKSRVK